PFAISFSPFQNASSRLTLVLWPAITIERLTTGDFIDGPLFRPGADRGRSRLSLTRGFNLANVLGLTKGTGIGVRTWVVLSPLVPLSNGPKIDHFSHSVAPRW